MRENNPGNSRKLKTDLCDASLVVSAIGAVTGHRGVSAVGAIGSAVACRADRR
ncbi:hypothetical protein DFP78_1032 [Photobacterium lutimaris]|nr:hypothetical protein DFP78_1032 [Photobacterium lutimaris]